MIKRNVPMKRLRHLLLASCFALMPCALHAQESHRWSLQDEGQIRWQPDDTETHQDHIEMSGKAVSAIIKYKVKKGKFKIFSYVSYPLFPTIPNNGYNHLRNGEIDILSGISFNGRNLKSEQVESIELKGILKVVSNYDEGEYGQWKIIREYFPSTEQPAFVQTCQIINTGTQELSIGIWGGTITYITQADRGVDGSYCIKSEYDKWGHFTLQAGDSLNVSTNSIAYKKGENPPAIDVLQEKSLRQALVNEWMNKLVLETPDPIIDRMFAFSKIRGCESIYETKGGPMHSSGGGILYAAIRADEQGQCINPFFPFMGYGYGNASALNSYLHFTRFINGEWKPIPSAIVAEGLDIQQGNDDLGNAAMIAYGAARYALARGSRTEAETLWPLIEWCLEYCRRQLNDKDIVTSDNDGQKKRSPEDDANLCTSSLYYDALISTSYLCKELGKSGTHTYLEQAATLRKNIGQYFGARIEGFDTYTHYKGSHILHSSICMPLTVGIDDRAAGTVHALFSPRLWKKSGLQIQARKKTFSDRFTLYALRGAYAVGATEKATELLKKYSATRLLDEHVPYAIHAWVKDSQYHSSSESGLYARIITEGMFGIRPTGFKSFTLTPRLPKEWPFMKLKNIHAFDTRFDVEVKRLANGNLEVLITQDGKSRKQVVKQGETIKVYLNM